MWFTIHHTAASLAVAAGANVKAVQRMLGHTSASMTLDVTVDTVGACRWAGGARAGEGVEGLSLLARHSRSACQAGYTLIGQSRQRVRRV